MALGGGSFTTQTGKKLPGAYINFSSVSSATTNYFGSRGTVAIILPHSGTESVVEWTYDDFKNECNNYFGVEWNAEYDSSAVNTKYALILREIFCHASKVVIGKDTSKASTDLATISKKPFNVLVCATSGNFDTYKSFADEQRDKYGVKFQLVCVNQAANSECVVSLYSGNSSDLVYWTAGALAGASFSESLCNMTYDGELDISTLGADISQANLETALTAGNFIFHRVWDEVRVLDDVNTYITDNSEGKTKDPEIFGDNQSVRIIDQIANDVMTIFANNYLGKVAASDTGRALFHTEIVDYLEQMQSLGGITDFNPANVGVSAGESKNSVVVEMAITLAATMKKLFMQVTVQ